MTIQRRWNAMGWGLAAGLIMLVACQLQAADGVPAQNAVYRSATPSTAPIRTAELRPSDQADVEQVQFRRRFRSYYRAPYRGYWGSYYRPRYYYYRAPYFRSYSTPYYYYYQPYGYYWW